MINKRNKVTAFCRPRLSMFSRLQNLRLYFYFEKSEKQCEKIYKCYFVSILLLRLILLLLFSSNKAREKSKSEINLIKKLIKTQFFLGHTENNLYRACI